MEQYVPHKNLWAMACPVAYTTPQESYSKNAAYISQSKTIPDPRKKSEKQQRASF